MSAPDNPDDKKDLNKSPNANQPETPSPEKTDAEASAEKKPAAAKQKPKPKPELSATKDPADKPRLSAPGPALGKACGIRDCRRNRNYSDRRACTVRLVSV